MAAAGAVACAGRDSGLECAVVNWRLTYQSAHLVLNGLLRLGVKPGLFMSRTRFSHSVGKFSLLPTC